MARKRLDDYPWQQDGESHRWLLRIDDDHSFVVFQVPGEEEKFGYTVESAYLGLRGAIAYDCCCNCAKWKCLGYLDRGDWAKLAPAENSNEP